MGRDVPHWTGRGNPSPPRGDRAPGGHRTARTPQRTPRGGRSASVVARSLVTLALLLAGCGSNEPRATTPAACLEAIQAARDTAKPIDRAFAALADYPRLVARAGQAGLTRDPRATERVSRDMRRITRDLDAAREQLETRVAIFNATAEGCQ